MSTTVKNFKHLDYLWDDNKAEKHGDDQVALFLYRSNILGADLRITNYGGGIPAVKPLKKILLPMKMLK